MERAAIFVGPDSPGSAITECKEACRAQGWEVQPDRVAVLDPEHPDQGLPVVLFSSASAPVSVLVVPQWDDLAQGLWGSLYHVKPAVKGRASRPMASGLKTFEAIFSALADAKIRVHFAREGTTLEASDMFAQIQKAYGPIMESAAEWDAQHSRAIREGQSRTWASGGRVGRPPREDRDGDGE